MTSSSISLPRVIWTGLKERTKAFHFVWLVALGLWTVAVVTLLTVDRSERSLGDIASLLKSIGYGTGMLLAQMATNWIVPPGQRAWLYSQDGIKPHVGIVALPVLTAMGTACIGFALAMTLAEAFLSQSRTELNSPAFIIIVWGTMLLIMLGSSLWISARASLKVHRWATQQAAMAAQSRADIERARLTTLQAQMNPHFLFNTLNTVAALAGPQSSRAERIVEHLSSVLRGSMSLADRPFTSLEEELRFLRDYLVVEEERLGPQLRLTWSVDEETLPMRVPSMCLLPLVENAIANAVESRTGGGHVLIASTLTAGGYLLRLSVEDYGPGEPRNPKNAPAFESLCQRLWAEYGKAYALDVDPLPTGARVTLSFPATRFEQSS